MRMGFRTTGFDEDDDAEFPFPFPVVFPPFSASSSLSDLTFPDLMPDRFLAAAAAAFLAAAAASLAWRPLGLFLSTSQGGRGGCLAAGLTGLETSWGVLEVQA